MKTRPECTVENCHNEAFVFFGGQWICGKCLSEYNNKIKKEQFNKMQEVLKK